MQIVGDNLLEMSNLFSENNKKNINLTSDEFAYGLLILLLWS